MSYKDLSVAKKREIADYYKKPNPIKKTCKHFGIGENSLYKVLNELGITKRTREQNGQHLYSIDKQFFYTESADLAYFLGLMGSDGYVSSTDNRVEIELQGSDSEVLEKIRKRINLTRPIKFYKTKRGCIKSKLYFEDKEIHNLLISRYGLCPRKTYDLENFYFPDISSQYYCDYIRGYFDGDRSIKITNKYLTFQIDGSNLQLLQKIKTILEENTGASLGICKREPDGKKHKIILYRIYGYSENAKKVFQYLYQNDKGIYLQRKYNFYLKEK